MRIGIRRWGRACGRSLSHVVRGLGLLPAAALAPAVPAGALAARRVARLDVLVGVVSVAFPLPPVLGVLVLLHRVGGAREARVRGRLLQRVVRHARAPA